MEAENEDRVQDNIGNHSREDDGHRFAGKTGGTDGMAIGEIQIRQQAGRDQNGHVFTGIGDSLPASSEDIQDKVQMIQGVNDQNRR